MLKKRKNCQTFITKQNQKINQLFKKIWKIMK